MRYSAKRKKSVALLWLVAYATLLIIPFLGNLYILLSVNSAVKQETESKYNYFLKSLATNIDSALKEVITQSRVIQESDAINQMAGETAVTPQVLYDLAQIGKEMQRMTGSGSATESFIYYPRIDKIVTSHNYYDAKDYFESDILQGSEEHEDYRDIIKNPYSSVVRKVTKDQRGKEKRSYIFLNTVGRPYMVSYVVGISIEEKALFGSEFDNNSGAVAVLKQRGDIYFSTNDDIKTVDLSMISGMESGETKKANFMGENAGLSYIKSETSNYRYVYVDRVGYVYGAANKILVIGALVSLICLLLMGMILYKLYGWSYLSIKEIMQGFNASTDVQKNENEFEFIKRQIAVNMQRQRSMEEEISTHMDILREEFLIELMRGSINDPAYMREGLEKFGIAFYGKYFCITVIYVRDMGILRDMGFKNAYFIIKNIMRDMCRNEKYYAVEYGDRLYCIFNFERAADIRRHLRALLSECGEVTKMATEIVFSSVTSEIGEGIDSLHSIYESAVSGMNLSEFYGMEEHIFTEDIENKESEGDVNSFDKLENEIVMCIRKGDVRTFSLLVDQLFSDQIDINHRWVVMGRAYSVLSSIYKTVDGMDSKGTKEAFERLNSFKNYDNMDSIKKFVKEYGEYVIGMLDKSSDEKSELYRQAVDYINAHYTELDLNVNRVSEELGVTSIYLAYIVKQNSGIKLSEYIAKLRVEKAKQILESEPGLKMEQVAEQSGFLQNRTFYNAFKKYTGITPNQYKIMNENKGMDR